MQENLSKIKMKEEQRTQDSTKDIFIPKTPKDFKEDDAFNYLQNIEIEINNGIFSKKELLLLENALYGKFLDKSRRSFFYIIIYRYGLIVFVRCSNIMPIQKL